MFRKSEYRPLSACLLIAGLLLSIEFGNAADFGRGKSGVLDNRLLPLIGGFAARFRDEQVSSFNLTDEEQILRNQARHLIAPPHSRGWLHKLGARLQRYRMTPPVDHQLSADSYYAYLRSDGFRSTAGRYGRVRADIAADAMLVHPFFELASRVSANDALRRQAVALYLDGNPNPPLLQRPAVRQSVSMEQAAYARIAENQDIIDWATRSLQFRIESYRRAVARLAIEEPDDAIGPLNGELQRLEIVFQKARSIVSKPVQYPKTARRSRYMTSERDASSDDPYWQPIPQK